MKAFRVKLFGEFITRLPEFNLVRHDDVPLPESSAEPYHQSEIKVERFVPSQDLSGVIIPMTGQDAVQNQLNKQKEKELLLGQYHHKMANSTSPSESAQSEEEVDEGFELIGSENQVVCLHSPQSSTLSATDNDKVTSSELAATSSSSEGDVVVSSDKAIQLALENQLQPHSGGGSPTQSKWVFSASIKLSLRKEIVEGETQTTPIAAICDEEDRDLIRQKSSDVLEEGIEIVAGEIAESDPQSEFEDTQNDHVSVLYVKKDDEDTKPKVRFMEEPMELGNID